MAFELPPLPYDKKALEPHISANTLDFHHGKHHQAYVTNLNNLIKDKPLESHGLEDIITSTFGKADQVGLFNNAAQVWNHTFFWHCMKPGGGGAPSGEVAAAIDASFGSMDKFKEEFKNACVTQFGSGWGWLVAEGGKLAVTKTPNA
ncbi:MAG: superoxide dismutase, partial [Rhodospirillales bacterium]